MGRKSCPVGVFGGPKLDEREPARPLLLRQMHLDQRPVLGEQLLHGPLHGPVGPDRQPAHEENAAPDGLLHAALCPRQPQLLPVRPLGALPATDLHKGGLRLGRQRELHEPVAPRVALLAHHEAPHELPKLREEAPQALGVGLGQEVAHEEGGLGLALSQPHLFATDLRSLEALHPPQQRGAVRLRPGAHAAQRAALAVRQRREPRQGGPVQGGEQALEARLQLVALGQVGDEENRQRQPLLRDRRVRYPSRGAASCDTLTCVTPLGRPLLPLLALLLPLQTLVPALALPLPLSPPLFLPAALLGGPGRLPRPAPPCGGGGPLARPAPPRPGRPRARPPAVLRHLQRLDLLRPPRRLGPGLPRRGRLPRGPPPRRRRRPARARAPRG